MGLEHSTTIAAGSPVAEPLLIRPRKVSSLIPMFAIRILIKFPYKNLSDESEAHTFHAYSSNAKDGRFTNDADDSIYRPFGKYGEIFFNKIGVYIK